jgi:hypothetical protein
VTWLAARAMLGRVPRAVWIALAVIAVLFVGVRVHSGKVKAYGKAQFEAGRNSAKADMVALQVKLNAANAKIAADMRIKNDAKANAIRDDATRLSVRGPGKAACPAVIPSRSGGSVAPGGQGNAAVDQVPDGERVDLIGLPFAGAVAGAEQADLNRAEVLSWREWYAKMSAEWGKR